MFAKGGATDHVWFYDVHDDGYSLDDKRDPLYQDEQGNPLSFAGDLPKVLEAWQTRQKPNDSQYHPASETENPSQTRHPGMDCRDPGHMDVDSSSHPWHLDSGIPCRNDDRTQACFWVSKAELAANKYDLSVNLRIPVKSATHSTGKLPPKPGENCHPHEGSVGAIATRVFVFYSIS